MVSAGKMARGNKSVTTSAVPSAISSALPSRPASPTPRPPFRFFDLAAELRVRIYEEVLYTGILDLDSTNYRNVHPRLALFLVCHRMHEEAYRIFYAQPVRLFPHAYHGFFSTKRPLLARLPPRYRVVINRVELRLGPGWSKPPANQNSHPSLGLADCTNLRTIQLFIELDPSESYFDGHRGKGATKDTYRWFCMDLLQGIIEQVPSLETVEIDAVSSLDKNSALIASLRRKVEDGKLRVVWASSREWESEDTAIELGGLEMSMSALRIDNTPRIVEVSA